MNYFKDCKTIDEVKVLYRKLAMENHPDKGGSTAVMQAVNSEYAFACAKILKGENLTNEEVESEILNAEKYRQALEQIINLEGLTIELVGTWIWVTGNTYPNKAKLKEAGFMFAPKKIAWYFRTDEYKSHSKEKLSLDEIKAKYGSKGISNNNFSSHALH